MFEVGDLVHNTHNSRRVIRKVLESSLDGTFTGEDIRNGDIRHITRPEHWSAVKGSLVVSVATFNRLPEVQERYVLELLEILRPERIVLVTHFGMLNERIIEGALKLNVKSEVLDLQDSGSLRMAFRFLVDKGDCLIFCPSFKRKVYSSFDPSYVHSYAQHRRRFILNVRLDGEVENADKLFT